jgi:hypothetical protein
MIGQSEIGKSSQIIFISSAHKGRDYTSEHDLGDVILTFSFRNEKLF